MDNNLHEPNSEISEKADIRDLAPRHFLAATGWGGVAGTLSIVVFSLLDSEPTGAVWQFLAGAIFVSLFTLFFSLAGMVMIGLPLTILLHLGSVEHRFLYATIGGIAGVATMIVFLGVPPYLHSEILFLFSAGGLAGFAAALRWGRWREALARYRQQLANEEAQPGKRSNPIHDLIH